MVFPFIIGFSPVFPVGETPHRGYCKSEYLVGSVSLEIFKNFLNTEKKREKIRAKFSRNDV